jgi:xylulokinase
VSLLLAVDLGTQSCRAAIMREDGGMLGIAARGYPLASPEPGWAEQRPSDWWEATCSAIRGALDASRAAPAEIAAVAVAGQMHGVVPVDAAREPTAAAVLLWCDKRADGICRSFGPGEREELERRAGNPLIPAWMAPKIAWLQRHRPSELTRACTILTPKDFINARLTGALATDPSEASGSFLFDAREERWSTASCEAFGVDPALLPEIHPSDAVVGTITAEAARATGLTAGTPVAAGGGDMLCLLLGAGLTRREGVVDVTGTAADIGVLSPAPIDDRRLLNLKHVIDGWVTFGILDAGGGSLTWLRDLLGGSGDGAGYEELSRHAASSPPGARSLLFLPYLQGERTLGSAESRGVFFGLAPHHDRGDLTRAVMEGVAFDLRQTVELLREHGRAVRTVNVTGGGSVSDTWNQLKADVYGATVVALEQNEGGVVGAAILAGLAAGVWPSAQAAGDSLVRARRTFVPDPERAERYDRLYGVFRELHDVLQGPFERLAAVRRTAVRRTAEWRTGDRDREPAA